MPLSNLSGVYGSSPPASDSRLPRGYAYGYKISIYIRILLIRLLLWFGNAVHLAIPVSASSGNFPSGRYPSSSLFGSYTTDETVFFLQVPDNPGNNTGFPCRSAGYNPELTAYAAQHLSGQLSQVLFVIRPSMDIPTILFPHRSMNARKVEPAFIRRDISDVTYHLLSGPVGFEILFRIFSAAAGLCFDLLLLYIFLRTF